MMDPITAIALGSAIAGGVGLLTSERPRVPGLASEDDIRRDLPQLYEQILRNRARIAEAQRMLAERRSGPTATERQSMGEARSNLMAQQGQLGLAGTSVGNAQQANMQERLRAAIAERAMAEEMQRQQLLSSLEGQGNQFMTQGVGMIGQQRNMQFQDDLAEQQARNQFYSGLLNSGIGMGANNFMADKQLTANQDMARMYYGQRQPQYPMYSTYGRSTDLMGGR